MEEGLLSGAQVQSQPEMDSLLWPVPETSEVINLRDNIINAVLAKLGIEAPAQLGEAERQARLHGLAICRRLNSYEEFERYLASRKHEEAMLGVAAPRLLREHRAVTQQVEETYRSLKFWVMLMNVQKCPC